MGHLKHNQPIKTMNTVDHSTSFLKHENLIPPSMDITRGSNPTLELTLHHSSPWGKVPGAVIILDSDEDIFYDAEQT